VKRTYSVSPRHATVTVEGSNPFDAEKRARREHPELRGEQLLIVAASLAWEREPYRSAEERLEDFAEQAARSREA
jgi:hypothetical protein